MGFPKNCPTLVSDQNQTEMSKSEISRFTKEVVYGINEDEFNKVVESAYGGSFDFVAIQEANNDSCYKYNVNRDKSLGLSQYHLSNMALVRAGHYRGFCTSAVFQCLLEDGYIEEGIYSIEVSW